MKISILLLVLTLTSSSVFRDNYEEAYKIAMAMTDNQKIGQTMQVDFYAITTNKNITEPTEAIKNFFGSLLVGGDAAPNAEGNLVNIPDTDEKKTIEIYKNASMENWQKLADKFNYSFTVTTGDQKTYSIKPILGTDAVHNNQHVTGTILFPHNIGLSCSHNPDHFYNVGKWAGVNVKKSGFNYAFAPTVAVSHNPQWGRYFQSMGQDDEMIYKYGKAFVEGLQGKDDSLTGVIGSVKHFLGDGATMYGADEGNAHVGNFGTFIEHNIQGYKGSIDSNVATVMCSYSGINWLPNAISPLLQSLLRKQLNFDGFVISDYDELNRVIKQTLPTSLQIMNGSFEAVSSIMNAGVDMMMIPGYLGRQGYQQYIQGVKDSLKNKTLTADRLNDAVARIISVKMAMGAVSLQGKNMREQPEKQVNNEGNEYEDSLTAVHESLVLLKNANVIPIKASTLQYIVLVGERIININNLAKNELFLSYDNIGMQCGGWTLRWQGFEGNSMWEGDAKTQSNASSIMDALKNLNGQFELVHPNYTTYTEKQRIEIEREQYLNHLKTERKKMNSKNTIILAVVGESPYAEFAGDVGIPYCQNQSIFSGDGCLFDNSQNPYLGDKQRASLQLEFAKFDSDVIKNIHEEDKNIPLVTVLLAGRPMLIDGIMSESSVVLDAFLPGTSGGQGIVDALTGQYVLRPNGQSDRVNSLSFDWPKSSEQLKKFPVYKASGEVPKIDDPLFKQGYGLSSFTGESTM